MDMRLSEAGSAGSDDEMKAFISAMKARRVPPNELGADVDAHPVLLRSADAVVWMDRVRVFTNGVELGFECRRRQHPQGMDQRTYGMIQLLVGVEFSDGRRGSSIRNPMSRPLGPAPGPDDLTVMQVSGHSSGIEAGWTYFVTPVPPAGAVKVVVGAPDLDLGEETVVLDAAELQRALTHVEVLWEWPAEPNFAEQAPPRPAVIEGGWFDRYS
jgi:hypothetical protein